MGEKKYKVGSDIYEIPEAEVQSFLKDFPHAQEVESYIVGKDTFDIPVNEISGFLADFPDAKPIKKKVSSEVSGESAEISSTEQPPLVSEQPKEERKTSRFGDVLRSLKSGSLRALGGVTGTPSFINRTLTGFAIRPIVRSMGGTDEDANLAIDNILMSTPTGVAAVGGAETQQRLIKKAQKVEEKMQPLEGSIWDNISKGNFGDAGELLGRGFAQSLPYLAMTAATAGGGNVAVLGSIGATASAQQYGELEGTKESKRILNSWLYGGFEAAGELVTAGLVRGVGKSFVKGATKPVEENFVKGVAKGVAKSFGLEGSSEAMTQIGQNFTDIVTGVDTNKNIFDGVLDAFLIGGVTGGGIGIANPIAAIVGRTMASDKEVKQVQENVKQQDVLIDQIDQTDSDPVKNALKKSIKDLQAQSDEVMDQNYELATKLSPEEQTQVGELYSVWNDLQAKIDNGEITKEEAPAIENTINGIKEQIQTIKDNLVIRLEEEAKAEKEAKIEEVKVGLEKEVDKLTEQKDKKIEKAKDVKEGETVDKKEIESIKKKFDDKIEQAKDKSEQELTKIEEETEDAKGIGGKVEETGEQAQKLVEGEESGLRVRDTEEDRVEAREGEEVITESAQETPQEPQITPAEPLSIPSEGNVPPVEETPPEATEKPPETKYRRTQINSLIQDQTLQQQEVAKIVDANKERYDVLHQKEAIDQAKSLIDNLGVQGASLELEKKSRSEELPIRQVARQVLLDFYSRAIVDPNASEADKKVAFEHIDRLQQITAREATSAGQSNAMLQIWKDQQPAGVLEFVRRKIEQSNENVLKKKFGDSTLGEELNSLFNTLNTESQNIVREIINDLAAGKKITLPRQEPEVKPPATRKYVPKERIKQEQDYRKNMLAEFKRKQGNTLSASATGLTSEQIELGGNLLASYIREGYYRIQEIIDRLKQDFKSVGVEIDDKQAQELLSGAKNNKETFGEYLERQEFQARVREGEKMISKRIADVVTEHWTVKDELKRTLAQKLIDEAGLTPEEAKRLEEKILKEFDQKILERSQKQLTKILGTQKIPTEKKKEGIVDKMIKLINMGALDEELYRDLFAEKFKLIKLTDQHKAEILRLATNVQMASGRGWLERDATIRLAKYIYELYPQERVKDIIDTWISLSYANMLFGPSTSVLNLVSAGSNMALKPVRNMTNLGRWLKILKDGVKGQADIYNPFGEMFYVPALRGISIGSREAAEVYKNGDLNNKYVENVAKKGQFKVTPLERDKYGKAKRFKPINVKIGGKNVDLNIFNLSKYSGRNLSAQDKLMLTTSYEIEIAQILRDKLRNTNLRGRALTKEVMAYIRGQRVDRELLNETLEEDTKLYKKMTGEEMTSLQKRIRERELELEQLPLTKEEREEAERLARSNIFTDDRGGLIASIARGIGNVANSSQTAGLIIKPFVPFTKIVGNVAEYMLDHTPYYGFMRANGLGVTGIYKKITGKDILTSQMGYRGSRAYYEQMGRAWFGTMAFNLALMMFLGKNEEDEIEISGGYNQEGFKKKGRENVLPPYTLRIGDFKLSYKNIPGLAIPLSLVGNINDALKAGQDEGDIQDRLTAALLFNATMNSVFMVKDMSFVEGLQRLIEVASDIVSTDKNKLEQVGEGLIRSYVGFMSKALPENNNAIQQIWKIFDPTSYSQSDIKGMLGYSSGLQHFVGRPVLDQFGEEVKTYPGESLMPYTHWLNIKGNDPRWQFLAKYNAIPNKIYNHVARFETKDGIEKRNFEEDELFDYTKRAGNLFSVSLKEYMNNKEKISAREKEFIERDKGNGETERISGVREDIEKLWSDAKEQAMVELFRWGSVKETMPKTWDLIKKYEAFFPYATSKQIEKYKLDDSELYQYNNRVTVRYAEYIKSYLESLDPAKPPKAEEIKKQVDDLKAEAEEDITKAMSRELKPKINKIK